MYTYNHEMKSNIQRLALDLCNYLLNYSQPPVFMCVGSSLIMSDCLGPICGTMLTKKHNIPAFVYGNLNHNITNENLSEYYNFIKKNHPSSPIIVIDSGLSSINEVGLVKFIPAPTFVGGFTNKNAQKIGSLSILGIVNTTGINSLIFLKSMQLKQVASMANYICNSINLALKLSIRIKQKPQKLVPKK